MLFSTKSCDERKTCQKIATGETDWTLVPMTAPGKNKFKSRLVEQHTNKPKGKSRVCECASVCLEKDLNLKIH